VRATESTGATAPGSVEPVRAKGKLLVGAVAVMAGGCGVFELQSSYALYDPDAGGVSTRPDGASPADTGTDARSDAAATGSDAGVVTLATGELQPEGIVHAGKTVYWASFGAKSVRAVTDGGAPTTVASTASAPSDLVTDDAYVYAVVGSTFAQGSMPGGACSDYVSFPAGTTTGATPQCGRGNGSEDAGTIFSSGSLAACNRIAVSSMRVFEVTQAFYGYLGTSAPAPGAPGTWTGTEELVYADGGILPSANPGAVATDGVTLYAVVGSQIWEQPAALNDLGSVFYQAPSDSLTIEDLAVDDTYLYWAASDGTVNRLPKTGVDGGAPTVLATGQAVPWRLAIYGGNLYWTNRGGTTGPGSVVRINTTAPVSVSTLATGLALPYGIYVDFTGIYWTNAGDGTVQRLPPL
jgi:hypothetical protein